MLDAGAAPIGDARECHAVAIDGRAPKFDGGIVTRLDCVPLGIVVNAEAERFYDEGEDFWPKRYAIWGKLVARQPGQIAYSIIDAKVRDRFMPSVYPPIEAATLGELAAQARAAGRAARSDRRDVQSRRATGHVRSHDARRLPHRGTRTGQDALGAAPRHAALRGYPLRPGITFTYLGVRVDANARVLATNGAPFANVYAAGEIMAGNVLRKGYIAGIGMTIGTVFGRIAGESAARHASELS